MPIIPPSALIDVRAVNDEAHPPALRNIGVGAVIPALVGKDGGHEFRRVMDPQIRRLNGKHGNLVWLAFKTHQYHQIL
jgi:hypothetical protein